MRGPGEKGRVDASGVSDEKTPGTGQGVIESSEFLIQRD
jgi:hypothetical protein